MKKKKILSLLLALVMCLTLIPAATVEVQAEGHNEKQCICGSTVTDRFLRDSMLPCFA